MKRCALAHKIYRKSIFPIGNMIGAGGSYLLLPDIITIAR